MEHAKIDALVNKMNVDTATGPVDARVQQVVVRLLSDLFKAIEDLDISPTELWKGIEYLTDAGQANELGLLAAGLGLEHFLDLRADEADAKAGLAGGTPRTIEGPLYVAGAPESVGFARMDDGSESDTLDTLYIEGNVFDWTACTQAFQLSRISNVFCYRYQAIAGGESKVVPQVLITFDVELSSELAITRGRHKVMHV